MLKTMLNIIYKFFQDFIISLQILAAKLDA